MAGTLAGGTVPAGGWNTTNADLYTLNVDANGNLIVVLAAGAAGATITTGPLGDGSSPNTLCVSSLGFVYNGSTFDRNRSANAASGTPGTGVPAAGMMGFDNLNWQRVSAQAFHNTDNQALGGTAFGLLSGGVAQLLNVAGNLDRQRSTGLDNIPALGIATGAAQFAMAFQTTCTGNLGTGTQTYTPAAMSGKIAGVPWAIKVGSVLTVDSGANQENVYVTATTSTTFTAVFAIAHNGSITAWAITGFVYNQERDAAGELDGATGSGTAVAAEYEYISGGPPTSAGVTQGFNFDRARAAVAKGKANGTISSGGGTNSTSIVLTGSPTFPPQPGQPIQLTGSGTTETVYVANTYSSGATIALQTGIVNGTQTTATWDIYAPNGPGLTGFLPYGLGIEEEAIFNNADGFYYIERSATADGMAGANLPAEGLCTYNETGWDRWRNNTDATLLVSAARTTTQTLTFTVWNQRFLRVVLDMTNVASAPSVTVTIDAQDAVSGKWVNILTGLAITTVSTNVYKIGIGLTAAANAVANDMLARNMRVVVTANNANSGTYSVGLQLSN